MSVRKHFNHLHFITMCAIAGFPPAVVEPDATAYLSKQCTVGLPPMMEDFVVAEASRVWASVQAESHRQAAAGRPVLIPGDMVYAAFSA